MNITLYKSTAEKTRVNKTLYLTQLDSITGTLREATSVTQPSIVIEYTTFPACNYAYIDAFNRYYFINEIISVGPTLWTLNMSVDVLMSYKGDATSGILSLSAYITRQETFTNSKIVDTMFPAQSVGRVTNVNASPYQSTDKWYGSSSLFGNDGEYRYIWRTAGIPVDSGNEKPSAWPMAVALMRYTEYEHMLSSFPKTSVSISGKTLSDYTYDMYALPVPVPYGATAGITSISFPGIFSQDFEIGTAPNYFPKSAFKTSTAPISTYFKATFSTPSSVWWQNMSPYTTITVQFLPFGKYQIDTAVMFETQPGVNTDIYFKVVVDPMSGNASLYYGPTVAECHHYLGNANVAIQLPTNTTALNGARIAAGAITTAAGIIAGAVTDGAGAALAAAGSGALGLAQACASPNTSITGGEQKIIDAVPKLIIIHHEVAGLSPSLYGKPYFKDDDLYDFVGYGFTRCGSVHVEGIGFETATGDELTEIESLLTSGVIL